MTQANSDPSPPADDRPHRPADDTEEVYFEGSPLLRAHIKLVLGWLLVALLLIASIFGYQHLSGSWPIWWISLSLVVPAILAFFKPRLLTNTLRYRITNYRIDCRKGLLARNTDTLELWHVEDIQLHQSLWNRMLNVGTIIIYTHDDTTPQLPLRGIPDPQKIFNMLKQRVIAVKRQRGVVKMDVGQ